MEPDCTCTGSSCLQQQAPSGMPAQEVTAHFPWGACYECVSFAGKNRTKAGSTEGRLSAISRSCLREEPKPWVLDPVAS